MSIYITKCYLSNGLLVYSNSRTPLHSLFIDICEHHDYDSELLPPICPNSVIVDIGANIGLFSLLAASISPDIKIHAFEPSADSFVLLQKNVVANGCANIQCYQYAVCGKTGETNLYLDPDSIGDSVLYDWVGKDNVVGTERVPCISLDDLFTRCGITFCDYLKMDCEGSEFDVLLSASSQTLVNIGAIALEYHEYGGRQSNELVELLRRNGFQVDEKRTCSNLGMLYALRDAARN